MTTQLNAAHVAVQAKPCPKQPAAPLHSTGQQAQAAALVFMQRMLERLVDALAKADATEYAIDALKAAELVRQHIARMAETQPMAYADFMGGWYMVASVVKLPTQVLAANSSPLTKPMQQAAKHFASLDDAVEFATFAQQKEVAHAD